MFNTSKLKLKFNADQILTDIRGIIKLLKLPDTSKEIITLKIEAKIQQTIRLNELDKVHYTVNIVDLDITLEIDKDSLRCMIALVMKNR